MTTENLTGHARHRLDEVIHAPIRFSIVATLAAVDEAEFSAVRDAIEISDSALSKQVSTLEAAGYVKVKKGPHSGRSPGQPILTNSELSVSPLAAASHPRTTPSHQ
jgi:DNA-binding HxlR family transcriptional regulator